MSHINDIKKALYKQKPTAKRTDIVYDRHHYIAELDDIGIVYFNVPESEMGPMIFETEMEAQLLIRWLT